MSNSGSNPGNSVAPLGTEEYIEQAHFFRVLAERIADNVPAQDVLASVREEVLATTKLPMALDFMLAELRHAGAFHTAMGQLKHYFTPFQAYIIAQAENERGKFDFRVGLAVLEREADYRAGKFQDTEPTRQGLFLYQFEVLCRNRLGYDRGLEAVASDPAYDDAWRAWIGAIAKQVGMVDIADLLYVQSEHCRQRLERTKGAVDPSLPDPLFGDREGRIALANRRKDPLYLFASLHRQLGYPEVPRPAVRDETEDLIPQMARRLEQLEKRMSLMEEEQRGGIDLTKLYQPPPDMS